MLKETKQMQIIKAAHDLFSRYGIKRVTIEEICKIAKVSKMTFYKYFKNKTDIAVYIYDEIIRESNQLFDNIVASDRPFEDKVKEMIRLKEERSKSLSQEFLNDILSGNHPELKKAMEEAKEISFNKVINFFNEAQKDGLIREGIKPEFIIYMLNHSFEMMEDQRLRSVFPDTHEAIMQLTNYFFYGIMTR